MSNALIDSLETRVNHAVETIESLKSENLALREDRQILEDKLRELLGKFEGVEASDASDASDTPVDSEPDSDATENSTENSTAESPNGLGNLGRGGNSSSSEY
jgi:FtsZ-binding cell division protein ZapB